MKRFHLAIPTTLLAAALVMWCSAFACTGSVTHKVTVAQHDFLYTVAAFQDAEIAEHDKGFVPDDLHIKMQQGIQKVALAGKDLDTALASGASTPTIKAKLDAIYTLLDSINNDGVAGIKNTGTKATLELALSSIKAIIANAETLISERENHESRSYS